MVDDAQLDMLIDGELDDAERRDVLSQLDAEPDGWRRCALAFLEAQSWREEMRTISKEPVEVVALAPRSRPSRQRILAVLAVAASFLLALGLGLAIGKRFDQDSPLAPPTPIADLELPKETIDVEPTAVPSSEDALESAMPYQYVSIPTQDPVSGQTDSIRMPVVPRELLGEGWPYRLPAVLPDRVVQSLYQRGHDVVQQRRLVPFQAADGSRVVFPVDEVELVPVRNRGYQ